MEGKFCQMCGKVQPTTCKHCSDTLNKVNYQRALQAAIDLAEKSKYLFITETSQKVFIDKLKQKLDGLNI